jgi:Domain of unknown function (DUF4383)
MSHIPVNHPLRSFYRFLAVLAGLYILVFGVVAFTKTKDFPGFSQTETAWALGLRSNLAFAIVSIIAGAVVIVGALLGRNIDHFINIWGGLAFMFFGVLLLALLDSDANFFAFSMANVIVSFIIGVVLFTAGLYGRTGSSDLAAHEDAMRHSVVQRDHA